MLIKFGIKRFIFTIIVYCKAKRNNEFKNVIQSVSKVKR